MFILTVQFASAIQKSDWYRVSLIILTLAFNA